MKGFRTAVAVAGLAFGMLAGCNDYNNSIQYNTGPQIGNLAPSRVVAASGSFLLTVTAQFGSQFRTTSVIQWNGQKQTTNVVDAQTLTATIPAELVAKPGVAFINVLTPQSGTGQNGLSNTMGLNIYGAPNPIPTIASVSPGSAQPCGTSCTSASVEITISGTNFLPTSNNGGSVVTFQDQLTPNQQPAALSVASITDTAIKATIRGSYLANADTGIIQVVNPPNGLCTEPGCLPLVGGGASPQTFCFAIGSGTGQLCPTTAQETPAISQEGRYVVYATEGNQFSQIQLKDTCVGVSTECSPNTRMISESSDGLPGNGDSHNAAMTPDGRYVAFSSAATNLAEGAPAGRQVYLRDTCIGAGNACKPATILISTDPNGALNGTEGILPSISASGRFVAFVAVTQSATGKAGTGAKANGQAMPNSGLRQVFVRDTCLGTKDCTPKTTRISMAPGDAPANGTKPTGPAVSGTAKQIALADRKSATVFTPTIAVDEDVVLATPKEQ
ncbi:MAG TPA: hypothetical protein VNI81_08380 [Candidatus Limnocylindrales bacterium]|nr:hypothetical protein [Candidatus Limnocylindrales bacterium]